MPINLLRSLTAIVRQIPDKQTVAYRARSSGAGNVDGYAAAVNFTARHGPITSGDFDGMEKSWCTWHLYALDGQVVSPERLGKITDAAGVVWHVLSATSSFGGLKHDCVCVQEVS